jgi:EAL domain-containing protein (putative c-di-GMP-specific phosphodiesterase class I)
MERQSLEDSLRHAIERCELSLHYQPKMNLATGTIIGVEALIRWCHPERGLVPPVQFIAIAEDSGLIVPIGRWVLREACRQARAWQVAGLPPMCMAINISAVELRTPGFVAGVRTILKETSLEPRYLELELTETALLEDSRSVADVLKELKDIGVLLALDDFGTGYSSLASLEQLPLTRVKLDRSLIQSIDTSARSLAIARAIMGLCGSLGLEVTAEGVERAEQLALLLDYPSICLQGYLICVPVCADAVPRVVGDMPQQLQSLLLTMPQIKALEHLPSREADTTEPRDAVRVVRSAAS